MKSKIARYLVRVMFGGGLIYFVLTSCTSVEPEAYGFGDNYEVYSKVLSETIKQKDIVIVLQDSTQQDYFIHDKLGYLLEHFPEASIETLENYIMASQNKIKLKRIPDIKFVFQSEYDGSIKNTVNVSLSNVGYNSNKTEAFVSIGALYAPLAGSGSIIFLVKVNNQWQIKKSVMTWIS